MENTISLYSSSGTMIYRQEIEFLAADEQVFLDHGYLSRGSYILIIQSGEKRYHFKIIKL
jgi:hypothetical protein